MKLRVIDSHTAGEPTRVVVDGAPDLGGGDMAARRGRFAAEAGWLSGALLGEPRGFAAMVGALLCEPHAPDCVAGVVFFNNAGPIRGCIHGTIGLVRTLQHLGRIGPGAHRIDTPVGVVTAELGGDGAVSVANVPSYRLRTGVEVAVPGHGPVRGDVAWGGNWFFLCEPGCGPAVERQQIPALTEFALAVMRALEAAGISGADGGKIDHVELFGPPADPREADSRNFVLCPGGEYDRSPCGTGTSAKLACLHAAGKLGPGQVWRQASILDTVFDGRVEALPDDGSGLPKVRPVVTGRAWVNGEAELLFDAGDPFRFGIA